jgi:hypothetical protein
MSTSWPRGTGFPQLPSADDENLTPIITHHLSHFEFTSIYRHSYYSHSFVATSRTPRTPQPTEDENVTLDDVLSDQMVGGIPLDGRVQDPRAFHRRAVAQHLPMWTPSGATNPWSNNPKSTTFTLKNP